MKKMCYFQYFIQNSGLNLLLSKRGLRIIHNFSKFYLYYKINVGTRITRKKTNSSILPVFRRKATQTKRYNEDRFLVYLPWTENHVPVLQITTLKY